MKRTVLAFALALGAAGPAFAHAQLQGASPPVGGTVAAPKEIRLAFSEGVEPKFCHVTLNNTAGAAQKLGPLSVARGDDKVLVAKIGGVLTPGAYTVHWRAVSVDTHRTEGSFGFVVK